MEDHQITQKAEEYIFYQQIKFINKIYNNLYEIMQSFIRKINKLKNKNMSRKLCYVYIMFIKMILLIKFQQILNLNKILYFNQNIKIAQFKQFQMDNSFFFDQEYFFKFSLNNFIIYKIKKLCNDLENIHQCEKFQDFQHLREYLSQLIKLVQSLISQNKKPFLYQILIENIQRFFYVEDLSQKKIDQTKFSLSNKIREIICFQLDKKTFLKFQFYTRLYLIKLQLDSQKFKMEQIKKIDFAKKFKNDIKIISNRLKIYLIQQGDNYESFIRDAIYYINDFKTNNFNSFIIEYLHNHDFDIKFIENYENDIQEQIKNLIKNIKNEQQDLSSYFDDISSIDPSESIAYLMNPTQKDKFQQSTKSTLDNKENSLENKKQNKYDKNDKIYQNQINQDTYKTQDQYKALIYNDYNKLKNNIPSRSMGTRQQRRQQTTTTIDHKQQQYIQQIKQENQFDLKSIPNQIETKFDYNILAFETPMKQK